jgi:biotin carboxyl carrier protein
MKAIRIGGNPVEPADASIIQAEPGVYSVIDNGNCYEVRITKNEASVNGRRFRFEIDDTRRWKPNRTGTAGNAPSAILAPMPGKVVRILVALGDLVTAGQGIIVVEAMKMQNEMKSPRDGRVAAIKTSPNESVNAGTVLALIEPL